MRRQSRLQRLLGQEQGALASWSICAQPFGGIGGIEGNVGAAGFEDAQHPDDHLQGALQAERRRDFRSDSLLAQIVGELVGAVVELR